MDGPTEDKSEPENRIKVIAVSDKKAGWISEKQTLVKPWTGSYKLAHPTPIQETRSDAESAKVLREASKGELFEHVEGPTFEGENIWLKAKAKKDGVVGWIK